MTIDSHTTPSRRGARSAGTGPELVLCAVDDAMTQAWRTVVSTRRSRVRVHRGSVLDIEAQAVVSPANSQGWMRGGIDAIYSHAFPGVEQRVRNAILSYHGGELPVGQALAVPTGESLPAWLISSPTMREPGERLAADTVHPYLAARAVFEFWRDGELEPGRPAAGVIDVIAMPGLGTGVGGVDPSNCARQVAAAWDEVFAGR
ncbi:MAG: macro domain-containing protein [Thermocrispum sp.]